VQAVSVHTLLYSVFFATSIGGDAVSLVDAFWIFCGFLIISQGFARLPFVAERRDIRLLALIVGRGDCARVAVGAPCTGSSR
jgi:hypothetical protein